MIFTIIWYNFKFFIGVSSFNSINGCLKCVAEGEYSLISRTVVFTSIKSPLRNDADFRAKLYGQHHKLPTPLADIPNFDLIEDIVVGDRLHLIDLGVMKRLLNGWRDGALGYRTKMNSFDIESISKKIVKDVQPFSIVDDEGFREYSYALEPSYVLPSRTTVSRSFLPQSYEDAVEKVKALLANEAEFVTLTTDNWTAPGAIGFMSVTAHYISPKWEMKTFLFECVHFPKSHTSENLRNELLRIIKDWGLERKVHTIVSDNAANIVRAIMLTGFNHIPCVAHTINLVVQDALKDIDSFVAQENETNSRLFSSEFSGGRKVGGVPATNASGYGSIEINK